MPKRTEKKTTGDDSLDALFARVETLAQNKIAPLAAMVDEQCTWPKQSFAALAEQQLLGLCVPKEYGGLGLGLTALVGICDRVAQACSSSAMCFGMHCVGTAVISAKMPDTRSNLLREIATGRHITTLALSETGTGIHFYQSETKLSHTDGSLELTGTKQFVTNGSHADSYVISVQSTNGNKPGVLSCLLIEESLPGMAWFKEWRGLGMRGNSSRSLMLQNVRVPKSAVLGEEGDQNWYIFQVIVPYFLLAMAGTYLGIAKRALNLTTKHVASRTYLNTKSALAMSPSVQEALAKMWTRVKQLELLIAEAARAGETGRPDALHLLLASKAAVGPSVIEVTTEALRLCGGAAYRENSELTRLHRDALAADVMTPTAPLLNQWLGRDLLSLPLFNE